jgi:hypothetical protein
LERAALKGAALVFAALVFAALAVTDIDLFVRRSGRALPPLRAAAAKRLS